MTDTTMLPYGPCADSFHVVIIQDNLTRFGFRGESDGYYGPETYRAVADYQWSIGLVPDGYVGQQTWLALTEGDFDLTAFDQEGDGIVWPDDVPHGK